MQAVDVDETTRKYANIAEVLLRHIHSKFSAEPICNVLFTRITIELETYLRQEYREGRLADYKVEIRPNSEAEHNKTIAVRYQCIEDHLMNVGGLLDITIAALHGDINCVVYKLDPYDNTIQFIRA